MWKFRKVKNIGQKKKGKKNTTKITWSYQAFNSLLSSSTCILVITIEKQEKMGLNGQESRRQASDAKFLLLIVGI